MHIITDMSEELLSNDFKMQKKNPMCVGCGCQINDQYILKVAPDLEWHATCLKCHECGQYLDENCTCFVRNGKTYCKVDYFRLFSRRCSKCKECFNKNDFVMRANNKIYHIDCFRCTMCNKHLAPGDEYLIRDDDLFCKTDSEIIEKQYSSSGSNNNSNSNNNNNNNTANTCQNITNLQLNSNNKILIKCEDISVPNEFNENQNYTLSPQLHNTNQHSLPLTVTHSQIPNQMPYNHGLSQLQSQQHHTLSNTNTNSRPPVTSSSSNSNNHHSHHRKDKTTRVRTVLNEKQLHTLRACYGANPRPDALMKEQLVEMTGLSPRVIRVWFQNKRCKDKKKSIMIKQMQEQQKSRQSIGHGIPMVATSPIQNDISNLSTANQVDIQTTSNMYQTNNLSWNYNNNDIGSLMNNRLSNSNLAINHSPYEQMMNFANSDEEDCFDNLSDQGNDDSVSSAGVDETRIQQL